MKSARLVSPCLSASRLRARSKILGKISSSTKGLVRVRVGARVRVRVSERSPPRLGLGLGLAKDLRLDEKTGDAQTWGGQACKCGVDGRRLTSGWLSCERPLGEDGSRVNDRRWMAVV